MPQGLETPKVAAVLRLAVLRGSTSCLLEHYWKQSTVQLWF